MFSHEFVGLLLLRFVKMRKKNKVRNSKEEFVSAENECYHFSLKIMIPHKNDCELNSNTTQMVTIFPYDLTPNELQAVRTMVLGFLSGWCKSFGSVKSKWKKKSLTLTKSQCVYMLRYLPFIHLI